jgi:hypothetical protein
MRLNCRRMFMAAVAILAPACASSPPPPAKAAQAEQIECRNGLTPQQEVRLVEGVSVLHNEQLYVDVNSGREDGLMHVANGALLIVVPPPSVTTEAMTRGLRCHAARAVLGQTDESRFPNDPYWLPNAWLDITVGPASGPYAGNYAVTVSADDIDKNIAVLHRADAFADAHLSSPQSQNP